MAEPRLRENLEDRTRQVGDVTVHFMAPPGQTVRPEDALTHPNTRFTRMEGGREVALSTEEAIRFLRDTFDRNGYKIYSREDLQGASAAPIGAGIWAARNEQTGETFVFDNARAATGFASDYGRIAVGMLARQETRERPAGGTVVAAGESSVQARAAAVGMSVSEYQDFQKRLDSNPVFEGVSVEDYVKVMNSIQDALGSIRETIRSGPQLNIAGDPAVSSAILNLQNTMIEAARRAERER